MTPLEILLHVTDITDSKLALGVTMKRIMLFQLALVMLFWGRAPRKAVDVGPCLLGSGN